jgi:hypothetical protein
MPLRPSTKREASSPLRSLNRNELACQQGRDALKEQHRAEAAEAAQARLREALEKIATHDGGRGDWVDDIFVDKPYPQEIAQEALASSSSTGAPTP